MNNLLRKLETLNENDAVEIVDLLEARYRAQEAEIRRQFEDWRKQCETTFVDESK